MTRHEAFIQKDWQKNGLAQILVARHRDDGLVDFSFFLVDFWCLGVKDVIHDNSMPASEFADLLRERIPEDYQERIHPACAKKLIEGAITYAEQFGFSPCRDFRKARKILSPLDASVCPTEFAYGRDGKPCYVEGTLDTPERTEKVLSILETRCGPDGFTYELLEEEDEVMLLRDDIRDFLDEQPGDVPRFYQVSGMITALLLCPKPYSLAELVNHLTALGLKLADQDETEYFVESLNEYWNYLNTLILAAVAPDAPAEAYLVDIENEDFEDLEETNFALTAACIEWCTGFLALVERHRADWENPLTRPDLTPAWDIIRCWSEITKPGNWDKMTSAAEGAQKLTLGNAVLILARALRKP